MNYQVPTSVVNSQDKSILIDAVMQANDDKVENMLFGLMGGTLYNDLEVDLVCNYTEGNINAETLIKLAGIVQKVKTFVENNPDRVKIN